MDNNLSTKLNTVESNISVMKTNWGLSETDSIETLTEVAQQNFQNKVIEITENKTQSITPDEGYNGLKNVEITTNVIPKIAPSAVYFSNWSSEDTLKVVEMLDTENMTSFQQMFSGSQITEIDLTHFKTSKVTDMKYMFRNCRKLTKLDISCFDMSKVTNVDEMFSNCETMTTLKLSTQSPTALTQLEGTFSSCKALTELDLSVWTLNKVTRLYNTFSQCQSLQKLDLRSIKLTWVNSYSTTLFKALPADCLIITQDDKDKQWVLSRRSDLTNVKTVAEYEVEQ